MESYLNWLQNLPLSVWITESESIWGYPFVLFLHAVGMGLAAGLAFFIDLRLLGVGKPLPVSSLRNLFAIFWGGFVLNAASGAILFMAAAASTGYVPIYYAKLTLIFFGVLTLFPIRAFVDSDRADVEIPSRVKTLAAVSFLLWLGVITTGRLIAYVR
jgi:hypothetical protein